MDGYVWINQDDIYNILYNKKKMSIEGCFYNFKTKQFDMQSLTDDNFIYAEGKKEYIAHGHVTAINIVHQSLKKAINE